MVSLLILIWGLVMAELSKKELLNITSHNGHYQLFTGNKIYQNFFKTIDQNLVIICDEALVKDYKLNLLSQKLIKVKAIEDSKDLSNIGNIISQVRKFSLKKDDLLIGIGGGIIQDITCFIASIYMRGVQWIYFPTTFLAMCDSCIGGKSSINVDNIKNLVGNFYPPKQIYIDLHFAKSLSEEQIDSGICESLKICYIHDDRRIFDQCYNLIAGSDKNRLFKITNLTLTTKKYFIEIDEFDVGKRQLLNFGHTFGHAIESASHYEIPHGIAVGFGMLWSICFSEIINESIQDKAIDRMRLQKILIDIISPHKKFVTTLKQLDVANIFENFTYDKKHKNNQYICILLDHKGLAYKASIEQNEKFLDIFRTSFEKLKLKFL
jgi:3-dehydroquinate synthase